MVSSDKVDIAVGISVAGNKGAKIFSNTVLMMYGGVFTSTAVEETVGFASVNADCLFLRRSTWLLVSVIPEVS